MLRCLVAALLAIAMIHPAPCAARIDRVQRLTEMLGDRDYRVRLQAALALGKLKDKRAVPALIRALGDRHPLVRGMVAVSLGTVGDSRAALPLKDRLIDADPLVRKRAKEALDLLHKHPSRRSVLVRLGSVGDRTRHGRALVPELRRLWGERIGKSPGLELTSARTPNKGQKIYEVTSSITELKSRRQGSYIETTCSISVILGDHRGSIVMMTTGGATVQVQSKVNAPHNENAMQTSALEGAITSAHANLVRFLATRQ
jgi:hypothetical protein